MQISFIFYKKIKHLYIPVFLRVSHIHEKLTEIVKTIETKIFVSFYEYENALDATYFLVEFDPSSG